MRSDESCHYRQPAVICMPLAQKDIDAWGHFEEMQCCLLVGELRQIYICLKVCGIGWADAGYTRRAEHAAEGHREIERSMSMAYTCLHFPKKRRSFVVAERNGIIPEHSSGTAVE